MAETAVISDERWEDLLYAIQMGKVVPIIGRRLSLVKSDDGSRTPLLKAAALQLAGKLKVDPLPEGWGLAELHNAIAKRGEFGFDSFHLKLRSVIELMQPDLEPLRKLADIRPLRLFLSTAFDGFLEKAVREVRSPGDTVTAYTFAPGHANPQQPIARPGEVCVYQLLGNRETCPTWAVTAEELVEFVLGMISEKYRPEQLFAALKDKHLLAIGCQIPDWLGRFFLRALRNGPIAEQKGTHMLVDDAVDADAAFGRWLQMFGEKALVVPGDAVGFVDELHKRWNDHCRNAGLEMSMDIGNGTIGNGSAQVPQQSAKVFLSYAHEDATTAQQVYDYLRTQGVDVWKDDRDDALVKGGNWDHEIRRQIADCACFVPLIASGAAAKRQGYLWKEWNLALDRWKEMDQFKRRFIFPVLSDRSVELPEQFKDSQSTLFGDEGARVHLANSLRDVQRQQRKEAR